MSDLIARFLAWFTRAIAAPAGKHCPRSVPVDTSSLRCQYEGVAALLSIARTATAPARRPVRRGTRPVVDLIPAPDPILMDGDDPRRYQFVRPSYRAWERQARPGDLSELTDVVRLALSMGIGR